jgi:hypothetical protein
VEVLNVRGYRLKRAGSRSAETMKFMCRRREWIKKISINLESNRWMNIIFFPDFDLHIILRLLFRDVTSATLSCKARATGALTQLMSSSRVFRNCCYHFHLFYSRLQEVLLSQFPIFIYLFESLSSLPRSFSSHIHGILLWDVGCARKPFRSL